MDAEIDERDRGYRQHFRLSQNDKSNHQGRLTRQSSRILIHKLLHNILQVLVLLVGCPS